MPLPNILVTGTPGAGKTHFAKKVAESFNLKFLEISKIVQENSFTDGFDQNLDCPILDEDKVTTKSCHELTINKFSSSVAGLPRANNARRWQRC